MYTAVGISIWSIPMALAVKWHIYSGVAFGILGWVVVIIFVVNRFRGKNGSGFPAVRFEKADWYLLAVLAVTAGCYFTRPAESIIGGRDMGIYTNHAIYIAHHGRLDVPYPWQSDGDTISASAFQIFPALYYTQPTMTVQFAHLYPIWLAQTFCSFDYQGMIRFNGLMGLLGLCILYGVFRKVLSAKYAIGAIIIIALNPGQLWTVHVTLTEIFTQFIIWTGFLLFTQSLTDKSVRIAGWNRFLIKMSI